MSGDMPNRFIRDLLHIKRILSCGENDRFAMDGPPIMQLNGNEAINVNTYKSADIFINDTGSGFTVDSTTDWNKKHQVNY
jgi:hypothetical protein